MEIPSFLVFFHMFWVTNFKNLYRLEYIEEYVFEFCRLPYGNILQNQNSSQWSCDFVIFISMKWHYNAMMSLAMVESALSSICLKKRMLLRPFSLHLSFSILKYFVIVFFTINFMGRLSNDRHEIELHCHDVSCHWYYQLFLQCALE